MSIVQKSVGNIHSLVCLLYRKVWAIFTLWSTYDICISVWAIFTLLYRIVCGLYSLSESEVPTYCIKEYVGYSLSEVAIVLKSVFCWLYSLSEAPIVQMSLWAIFTL